MILADTSVWADHLRRADPRLVEALDGGLVLSHPFVVGELACGQLRKREALLLHMKQLSRSTVATDDEVLTFIDRNRLMGSGIGYIDAHLLAAATLSDGARLWTRDIALRGVARRLGVAHEA